MSNYFSPPFGEPTDPPDVSLQVHGAFRWVAYAAILALLGTCAAVAST